MDIGRLFWCIQWRRKGTKTYAFKPFDKLSDLSHILQGHIFIGIEFGIIITKGPGTVTGMQCRIRIRDYNIVFLFPPGQSKRVRDLFQRRFYDILRKPNLHTIKINLRALTIQDFQDV